ncbi:MAG: hypothetical protein HIU92_04735 [Proteobacteria bacterium]|nr:hypothetical protein [Pseudomonadota bacterium]
MTVWVALSLIPTLMLLAVALDEGEGSLSKIELQRTADIAAIAGGLRAASSASGVPPSCASMTHALACAQTNAAADAAEVNVPAGAGTRSWTDSAETLSDNLIQAAIVPGVQKASDTAVKVSVSRPLPAILGFAVDGGSSFLVKATATAEVVPGGTSGTQPCMTALDGSGSGVTTNLDISISGNANLTMNGCSLRSDGRIALSGNVNLVAAGIYAGSTISSSGNANMTGTQYPDSGQISDPYASDTQLQNAFSKLTTQTTNSFSGGGSPSPGTYSTMNITSNTTLAPGLYVVTGNFSVGANSAVNGSGVTIIAGGSVSISGNANFNVTAPGTSAAGGAIPGVLLADNGTSGGSISGNASSAVSGVIYFPNSTLTFSGNGATNGQSNCLEVIAGSVSISGNTNMGGNCSQLGALSFGSVQTTPLVELVQ